MATRHVIVGSGIAGLAAAETVRERDPHAGILIVSAESHDFYSRPGLAYLLRGDIPEKQLFVRTREDLRALNAGRLAARAQRVLCREHELLLDDGERLPYDRLAAGHRALAVSPPFPGGDLPGVVKLDSLDDTRHHWPVTRGPGRGGRRRRNHGSELAEGVRARHGGALLLRGTWIHGGRTRQTESEIVLKRLQHEGVRVHTHTQVKQAIGKAGRVASVETQAGETFACDVPGRRHRRATASGPGERVRLEGGPRRGGQRVPGDQRARRVRGRRRGRSIRPDRVQDHASTCSGPRRLHRVAWPGRTWRASGARTPRASRSTSRK